MFSNNTSNTARIPAGAQPIRIASPVTGQTHLFASYTPTQLCFYRRQDGLFYYHEIAGLLPEGGWELVQVLGPEAAALGVRPVDLARSLLKLHQLVRQLQPLATAQGGSPFDLAERILKQQAGN